MLIVLKKPEKNYFTTLFLLVFLLMFLLSDVNAKDNIPEELKSWQSWVLKDNPDINCPIIYNQNETVCSYPNSLSINMNTGSGSFKQLWVVYSDEWVTLPGDYKIWPKNVRVNQKPQLVTSRNNKPAVLLKKGRYRISGEYSWQKRPDSLSIPHETGLVFLTLDNKKINFPDLHNGKLWLKNTDVKSSQNNRLDIQVFRKITDTIPLRITTQIKIDVSGQQREVSLDGVMLDGFKVMSINSRLPAKLNNNGLLKIQVRPGQWNINVTTYNVSNTVSIDLPEYIKPWPKNEIWVIEQLTQLRLIKVVGKNSIDPNQSQLPTAWKSYPAYNMRKGETFKFEVLKRGNPEPEPDQLVLNKKIWLDFSGDGFTVNDTIKGKLSRQWRLNASDLNLGQVSLNGKPQFITENSKKQQGVEVRHGKLNLSADSRIEGDIRTISASGWDIDFSKVNATLYLPAGWKLMSLRGAQSNKTWLKKWTLLDLFMVLITAIAVYKLFGLKWGIIALFSLVLIWHEQNSPQYIWINLIIAVALLRVLPKGRFYSILNNYRLLSSLLLILIILPFVVNQVRTTLYPQLEFHNVKASVSNYNLNRRTVFTNQFSDTSLEMMQEPESVAMPGTSRKRSSQKFKKFAYESDGLSSLSVPAKQLSRIDPDAMIQTGPGLPSWKLHQYPIYWNGPVSKEQKISMIVLSPPLMAIFKIVQIVFMLLLAWRLLDFSSFKISKTPMIPKTHKDSIVSVIIFAAVIILNMTPIPAEAAYPPQKMLEELKNELTKPAECLPGCADIESMSIDLSEKELQINLKIHAFDNIIFPLPIPIKQWIPANITVDGKNTTGMVRKDDSTLWLHAVKGTHVVKISGRVDYLKQLQFSFPLKPHHISLKTRGWLAEGMDKDSYKITGLTFLRLNNKNNSNNVLVDTSEQSEIPVFAQVSRVLELGLDWYVTTQVEAISGSAYPVVLNIPLLRGESVVTENIKVRDHQAVITLNKNQRSVSWVSKLSNSLRIKLEASKQEQYVEHWAISSSPLWHIEYKGIPVIYHQRIGNNWRPEWQPWPGETVTIDVSRPGGIKGKTLTIDSSQLTLTPGEQLTTANLNFNIRSSLGGQHVIQIPGNADLQTVKINNQNMPIRKSSDGLSLPVTPGNHNINIEWRESRGINGLYQSSKINLGTDSVNNAVTVKPGYNRWVLFVSGPTMGPAILFWGMLIVIIVISYFLGRLKGTPLNSLQWVLLGFGLSASGPWGLVIIAAVIFALRARGMINTELLSRLKFNLIQLGLICLIFISISTLLSVIEQGLLGSPDMQITGNGSSSLQLNWYSDRIEQEIPLVTVFTVPVYVYRLMMLLWSIWLAFALIKWSQWGWTNYTKSEYWRSKSKIVKAEAENKNDETQNKHQLEEK